MSEVAFAKTGSYGKQKTALLSRLLLFSCLQIVFQCVFETLTEFSYGLPAERFL